MSDVKQLRGINSCSSPLSVDGEIAATTSSRSIDLSFVDVDHLTLLSSQLGNLLEGSDNTDVTFVVEGEHCEAHRVILAARCEYFRALFYGGMKEATNCDKIDLPETPINAFKHLLTYIYTGLMSFREIEERDVLDILILANRYSLLSLESAITGYLKDIISESNVGEIYDVATFIDISDLVSACNVYIDHHATNFLNSDGFARLSKESVKQIISRQSFEAPEIDIFHALKRWMSENEEECSELCSCVRLPLIDLGALLNQIRFSKIYSADEILDAVKMKHEHSINHLPHRGFLLENENIAQSCHNAVVLSGGMKEALLDVGKPPYDSEKGYTMHKIKEDDQGIIIQLQRPSIINTIKLLLWDLDSRSYSYKIEYSMNNDEWACIVDYSRYFCRSFQLIHFDPIVAKYVRVVGTYNSQNNCFHLVSFQCMYSTTCLPVNDGIIVPSENVASIKKQAVVIEGVSRNRNVLIDGSTKNYDLESGYTCHQIGSGSITIQLAQPYYINSMRMLLWDCDDRSYCYYIQVSLDRNEWDTVWDRQEEPSSSWQTITFPERPVSFIKITGTKNTSNEAFHVVHFECPAIEDVSSDPMVQESVTVKDAEG